LTLKNITRTAAITGILIGSLTFSGGVDNEQIKNVDVISSSLDIKYNQSQNATMALLSNNNGTLIRKNQLSKKNKVKIENVANDLFGKMRSLTPEENKMKDDMYIKISEPIEGASFFD